MPCKPCCGNVGNLLQRTGLLKQMSGSGDDGQFLLDSQLRQRRAIEAEHLLIPPADDEQGGGFDLIENLGGEIRPPTPRHDRPNRVLPLPWANTTNPGAPWGTAIVPSRTPAPAGIVTSC